MSKRNIDNKLLLKINEAAELLGISRPTIQGLIDTVGDIVSVKAGRKLKAIDVGIGKELPYFKIARKEIDRFLGDATSQPLLCVKLVRDENEVASHRLAKETASFEGYDMRAVKKDLLNKKERNRLITDEQKENGREGDH